MLCNVQGCRKPARHTGLCLVIEKKRLRTKVPRLPYVDVDLLLGTIVNVWWENFGRYYTGCIVRHNAHKRKTKIKYVDGDVVWHFLDYTSYVVLSVPEEKHFFNTDHLVAEVKSMLTCSICLETFVDPVTARCMHTFCNTCLRNALSASKITHKSCPICRVPIKSMRDTVEDSRIKSLLAIMQCSNDSKSNDAGNNDAGNNDDVDEVSHMLLSLSRDTPGCAILFSSNLTTMPTRYNCRTCGGMKMAKAHVCGKTCQMIQTHST